MNKQSAFINEESHDKIVKENEEEKHKQLKKELKRKRNCERQRAYYQRQKDLKKNEENKKKVPKTNAERQKEFRQRKAQKFYVNMKRRKLCSNEENVVQGRAVENIENVTLQENQFHSQQLHIYEQRNECITPEVILHRTTGIPGDELQDGTEDYQETKMDHENINMPSNSFLVDFVPGDNMIMPILLNTFTLQNNGNQDEKFDIKDPILKEELEDVYVETYAHRVVTRDDTTKPLSEIKYETIFYEPTTNTLETSLNKHNTNEDVNMVIRGNMCVAKNIDYDVATVGNKVVNMAKSGNKFDYIAAEKMVINMTIARNKGFDATNAAINLVDQLSSIPIVYTTRLNDMNLSIKNIFKIRGKRAIKSIYEQSIPRSKPAKISNLTSNIRVLRTYSHSNKKKYPAVKSERTMAEDDNDSSEYNEEHFNVDISYQEPLRTKENPIDSFQTKISRLPKSIHTELISKILAHKPGKVNNNGLLSQSLPKDHYVAENKDSALKILLPSEKTGTTDAGTVPDLLVNKEKSCISSNKSEHSDSFCCWYKREQLAVHHPTIVRSSHRCVGAQCRCCCKTRKITINPVQLKIRHTSKLKVVPTVAPPLDPLDGPQIYPFPINHNSIKFFDTSSKDRLKDIPIIIIKKIDSVPKLNTVVLNSETVTKPNLIDKPDVIETVDSVPVLKRIVIKTLEALKDVSFALNEFGKLEANLGSPIKTYETNVLHVLDRIFSVVQDQIIARKLTFHDKININLRNALYKDSTEPDTPTGTNKEIASKNSHHITDVILPRSKLLSILPNTATKTNKVIKNIDKFKYITNNLILNSLLNNKPTIPYALPKHKSQNETESNETENPSKVKAIANKHPLRSFTTISFAAVIKRQPYIDSFKSFLKNDPITINNTQYLPTVENKDTITDVNVDDEMDSTVKVGAAPLYREKRKLEEIPHANKIRVLDPQIINLLDPQIINPLKSAAQT